MPEAIYDYRRSFKSPSLSTLHSKISTRPKDAFIAEYENKKKQLKLEERLKQEKFSWNDFIHEDKKKIVVSKNISSSRMVEKLERDLEGIVMRSRDHTPLMLCHYNEIPESEMGYLNLTEGKLQYVDDTRLTSETIKEEWDKEYRDVLTCSQKNGGGVEKVTKKLRDLPVIRMQYRMNIAAYEMHRYDQGPNYERGIYSHIIRSFEQKFGSIKEDVLNQILKFATKDQEDRQVPILELFRHYQHSTEDRSYFKLVAMGGSANPEEISGHRQLVTTGGSNYVNHLQSHIVAAAPHLLGERLTDVRFAGESVNIHGMSGHCWRGNSNRGYVWNQNDILILRERAPKVVEFKLDPMSQYYAIQIEDRFSVLALNHEAYRKTEVEMSEEVSRLLDSFINELDDNKLTIIDAAENRAIETLREEISEFEFRRYIKRGFITVVGSSGRVYQIFRDRQHIKAYWQGQLIEELCIYIPDGNVPVTDKLIAFKTMIDINEDEFRKYSNVYKMTKEDLELDALLDREVA